MENTLDPQAVNLAKAMRQVESGGNFQAKGKSGEYGAYQFTEPTWNAYASEVGVKVPFSEATPDQQNEVAYKKIKQWKDSGMNVGQIASMWNAGEKNKDAYLTNHSGTNKFGVAYNTPAYAKNVATEYQRLKAESGPTPDQTQPQEQGLGSQLAGRMGQAGQALTDAASGKINPLSGVLQTVGAGAGAIGDVIGAGLELIPGVKAFENFLGRQIKSAADTEVGKAVVGSVAEFAKAHPELADNIGAGFNIITAIPILKGLGAIGSVAKSGISQALKNTAEKSALKGLTKTLAEIPAGKTFLKEGGEQAIKEGLIDTRHILGIGIQNGKYFTGELQGVLENELKKIGSTGVGKAGADVIGQFGAKQAVLEKAIEALKLLDGQDVATSLMGKAARTAVTGGMIAGGEALGIPGGGILGYATSRGIANKVGQSVSRRPLVKGVLKNSGVNATKITKRKIAKTGLIGAALRAKQEKK